MILTFSTELDADADTVWPLIKKTATFLFVTRGLLGLSSSSDLPDEWTEGYTLHTRLWLFHILPAWRHELRVVTVSEMDRLVKTNEKSGPLGNYSHTLSVGPVSQECCRYSDTLDLGNGMHNWLSWPILQVFFRYRQMRLRRLVRSLIKLPPALEVA